MDSNDIDYRSNDEKDDSVGLGGREKRKEKKKKKKKKRELIILKSDSKPDERKK